MRANTKNTVEVREVEGDWFHIRDRENGFVIFKTDDYELVLSKDRVVINYTVKRPNHDHNDSHRIIMEFPEGGIVDPTPFGTGRNNDLEFTYPTLDLGNEQRLRVKVGNWEGKIEVDFWKLVKLITEQND